MLILKKYGVSFLNVLIYLIIKRYIVIVVNIKDVKRIKNEHCSQYYISSNKVSSRR